MCGAVYVSRGREALFLDKVVFFGEKNFVEHQALRQNLVRIPEIYESLSKAQKVWDELPSVKPLSFHNVLYRNEEFFETHKEIFDLVGDLVQLGLIERLKNRGLQFKYILSSVENCRADLVHLKKLSLKELVSTSMAAKCYTLMPPKIRLIGLNQNWSCQYRLFRKSDCGLKLLEINKSYQDLLQNHLDQAEVHPLCLELKALPPQQKKLPGFEFKDFIQADGQLAWLRQSLSQEVLP